MPWKGGKAVATAFLVYLYILSISIEVIIAKLGKSLNLSMLYK
ncbi:MAG: hypothetical protein AB8U30_00390 [Rickettsiales endosymbiont of Dermacentor nuttalli]